jgi:hypothetical protein
VTNRRVDESGLRAVPLAACTSSEKLAEIGMFHSKVLTEA